MTNNEDVLSKNLDKIHTTEMGLDRIRKNLQIDVDDVIGWCKGKITDGKSVTTRKGKNWYVTGDGYVLTINAQSYTIITAHSKA
jgi:Protein of unknown function (DUF3781)